MTPSKGYGWKPSLPDVRDHVHSFAAAPAGDVDLRASGHLPSVWDQGNIGSCVMHGCPAALVYSLSAQGLVGHPDDFMPSRLFGYYVGREMEGTVGYDSGLTVRDGIREMNGTGLPPESDWPYVTARFTDKPSAQAFADAPLHEAVKYARVPQDVSSMRACLASGLPFVVGFTVYESFESDAVAATGDVPMPGSGEQTLGGHCVLVVGHIVRNGEPVWVIRNSWGESWGDHGHAYMPEAYLLDANLASDFWTVQTASAPDPGPTPTPDPTPDPTPGLLTFLAALLDQLRALVSWLADWIKAHT